MRLPARHFFRAPRLAPVAATLLMAVALGACSSGIDLDEPIEGPMWRLVQLGEQRPVPGPDAAREPHVQFDLQGRVSGSGGCNRLSGGFTRNGAQLRLSQLGATRMACADAARSALETAFFQALQTTASYRLSGPGQMALLDANGRTLARLEAGQRR
ncbi:META domain-containing protein [Xenophilus arseniciresistens]|uniref:META domain-containing protein n=1 Tax=Xenophilus arseniciresistens TaxID=1283306 RepID=A0AAE3T1Y4_9BURK|nr:META domain-containing protein [Xenophilus arseniciresistens]MDA7418461.1 META domain-containing protein [Xenophilus arseniciresistens]